MQAAAGRFAVPEDPRSIASVIREMADDPDERRAMGERGRAWVLANATRESLAERYLGILEGIARRR